MLECEEEMKEDNEKRKWRRRRKGNSSEEMLSVKYNSMNYNSVSFLKELETNKYLNCLESKCSPIENILDTQNLDVVPSKKAQTQNNCMTQCINRGQVPTSSSILNCNTGSTNPLGKSNEIHCICGDNRGQQHQHQHQRQTITECRLLYHDYQKLNNKNKHGSCDSVESSSDINKKCFYFKKPQTVFNFGFNLGSVVTSVALLLLLASSGLANPDAKRLYDDLLSNYNRLIRPASNSTDAVLVKLGLRLSQLIDLNTRNPIRTPRLSMFNGTGVIKIHKRTDGAWSTSITGWDRQHGNTAGLLVEGRAMCRYFCNYLYGT